MSSLHDDPPWVHRAFLLVLILAVVLTAAAVAVSNKERKTERVIEGRGFRVGVYAQEDE